MMATYENYSASGITWRFNSASVTEIGDWNYKVITTVADCSTADNSTTWGNTINRVVSASTIKVGSWFDADYPTTGNYWGTATTSPFYYYEAPVSAEERMKRIIGDRMNVHIHTSRTPLKKPADIREVRARETLRRVLGEAKYFAFVKKGFVHVQGKSGKFYQIFPGHGITSVYENGKMVERLCVVLSGDFPPTDSIIMRYLLILNNEDQFRSLAIKHSVFSRSNMPLVAKPQLSLAEIYKGLKGVA